MEEGVSKDICVDASLWVRLLAKEDKSEEADKIFSLWMEEYDFFIAPSFLIFDVASALRKKYKRGELSTPDFTEMIGRFYAAPVVLYQSQEFLGHVWEWAKKLNETVIYDVSYLALAAWKKVPYWTADEQFHRVAKKHYADSHLV